MNTAKVTAIVSILFSGFLVAPAFAEAPAAPSSINSNDHAALANYYEGLAKEISGKLEAFQQELDQYEDRPYTYGRQGQSLRSHLQANIREYKKELAEDLREAELHREILATEQNRQFNRAEADVGGAVVR